MDRIRQLAGIDEVASVEASIDSTRNRCHFLLGIQTGLRGSQLVALRLGDAQRAVLAGVTHNVPKLGNGRPTVARVN